ncbi:CPBP family intramembrane glutamic endopeptidase [Amorphus orientalis]|uniref:Membrane protease YdiL (CAAX protease family) n=1 Tax=Amorphus orientalis TaxID=649198 RepID=A0AAE3VQI1_9HYPH|nr:CPBP family intramembrane glutamic endopeptidase [Amorphus orientalis]MDQ0316502.1 membrane protease YdiL (CAAX protease family) [Amorphus orientalis]
MTTTSPTGPDATPSTVSPGRRLRLWIELVLLFVVAPPAVFLAADALNVRVFMVMAAVLPVFILLLIGDRRFPWRATFLKPPPLRELASVFALFVPVAALVALVVWWVLPGRFLMLPRYMPELWLTIMIFYPLASAASQELIYRVLFFHRYEALFRGHLGLMIAANAVLFGAAHILFGNWVAIVLTTLGGILFAWRYERTRSFWPVWLEHSLYGNLVFTIGLGRFLYSGA